MNEGIPWFRRIFPKKHFEWKEPAGFREIASQFTPNLEKPWHKPLMASVLFLILFSQWLGQRLFGPDDKPPMALPEALVIMILLSAALIYFLPWIVSKCPVYIRLLDDQLVRMHGNIVRYYKLKDIAQYSIQSREGFWILSLQLKSGRQITVGVSNHVTPDAVAAFLSKAGLKRRSDLVPTNTPVPGMS